MTLQYGIRLDRQMNLQGVYSAGNTTWTMPVNDETIDAIVLGPDFGASEGAVLTPSDVTGDTVTVAGDYTTGVVVIGRLYQAQAKLTRVFRRGRSGDAILDGRVDVSKILVSHTGSGPYNVRSTLPFRANQQESSAPPTGLAIADGTLKAWNGGDAEELETYIEATATTPITITSIEYIAYFEPRRS